MEVWGVACNSSPRSPVVQPTVAWKGACCRVCLSHQPAERSRYGLCRKAHRRPSRPSPYPRAARRQALRHTPSRQPLGAWRGHTGHRHDEAHRRCDRRAPVSSARNARALLPELRHDTHARRLRHRCHGRRDRPLLQVVLRPRPVHLRHHDGGNDRGLCPAPGAKHRHVTRRSRLAHGRRPAATGALAHRAGKRGTLRRRGSGALWR